LTTYIENYSIFGNRKEKKKSVFVPNRLYKHSEYATVR
jgi:hypothetical protein